MKKIVEVLQNSEENSIVGIDTTTAMITLQNWNTAKLIRVKESSHVHQTIRIKRKKMHERYNGSMETSLSKHACMSVERFDGKCVK